jgi:uncharacterized SAM-binding protein YcdF (DUF218 family)
MGFELAKAGGFLLSPACIVLAMWLASLLSRARAPAASRWLGVTGFVLFWLLCTPAVVESLSAPLDERYPELAAAETPAADAIVVLGGALSSPRAPRRQFTPGMAAARVWFALELFRAGKAPRIVIAAGNQDPDDGNEPEAQAIADMLVAMGVPRDRLLLEGRSRNTRENADFSLPLVRAIGAKRVLLVTSAWHMPRALGTFEQHWKDSGIELVPAVCDVPRRTRLDSRWAWLPSGLAFARATQVEREYLGLLALQVGR